jgi:hypothetical protein
MTKANNPNASTKEDNTHFEPVEQGAHSAGKPVVPREGDGYHSGRKLPKPEEVTTLPLVNSDKKAIECAEKQNTMDDGSLAQVPAGKNFPTVVSSGN